MTKELTTTKETTPAALLELAVSQGADVDKLEKLMELQLRWETNEAKKSYHKAMAAFKQKPPVITKDKTVAYKNTMYKHASLENVTTTINKSLSDHGLSASWTTGQENGGVSVTCIITHVAGHSESTTLSAMPDNSGAKNDIQQLGSSVTYLQRYTILALTGLATGETDNDGQTAGAPEKTIDKKQEAELLVKLRKKNYSEQDVYAHYPVKALNEITVPLFNRIIIDLEMVKVTK